MCELARFEEDKVKYYSCDEVRLLRDLWKRNFRDKNATDQILASGMRDKQYEAYCESIDSFLSKCKCKDYMNEKCSICSEEDHEGNGFCRCELRNIKRAVYLREVGQLSWSKAEGQQGASNANMHGQSESSKREDSCKVCRCLLDKNGKCQECLLDKALK